MSSTDDSLDFAAARAAMIDSQLKPQGIADPAVLAAFQSVPRENFVAAHSRALAYSDRGAPGAGGGILSPAGSLAALVQALEPVAGERALVIGQDPAYASAIVSALGVDVVGDGHTGPVDLILVDGAAEYIPDTLANRLAPGGRLAAGIRGDGVTRLVLGRHSGGAFGLVTLADAYVPPLPGFERPRAFVF